MMDQYRRIKRDYLKEVLFFRLGDFYEMFSDDAVEVSSLLNLTLTSRNGLPMCGIPYHASRSYIARLLKFGKKIAICEQVSEPSKGKNLIERKVVEVITPGTIVDDDYLDKGSSNYLASFAYISETFSFSYIDLSTGDFYSTSFPFDGGTELFRQELERLQVKEIIVQESILTDLPVIERALSSRSELVVNRWASWLFDIDKNRKRLEKQFGRSSLKGFGLDESSPEILSAGVLLDYLDSTAKSLIPHIRSITLYRDAEYVGIDESTQRNLELTKNLRDGDINFTLLEVMDETRTSMGRRLLKHRLLHPLQNLELINKRLDIVEIVYNDPALLNSFRELFSRTPDIERLNARLAMDRAHGKDMLSIKNTLSIYSTIEEHIEKISFTFESDEAAKLDNETFSRLMALRDLLEKGIAEDPSVLLTEGNLIRAGYNARLDGLKELQENGRQLLEAYLEEERLKTGIASLKIRYNRLIGYFFEVTKAHLPKVPSHFIRRQGTVAGERFTTDKLSALESEINSAADKVIDLEKQLFLELRDKAKELISELACVGKRIAELDVAQSLARSAMLRQWLRPVVDYQNRLDIVEGRHPVVAAHLPGGEFIPNDVILDVSAIPFALITGPNMAGKSTYLRQAALITIMAQMGSFVPAKSAAIGIADKIYCRVGASDNLARGESTFLVEMNETAYILHTATERSLVIMDEVGRGTGTIDGLSIAQAVCEELLDNIKCRTLFATHFHELALIQHPRLANRSMEVLDQDGNIIFLRKLKEGHASESYGLHAARLAGLSERVLYRAQCIMERIEESGKALYNIAPFDADEASRKMPDKKSFEDVKFEQFLDDLLDLDVDNLTPMEALKLIHGWKDLFLGRSSRKDRPRRDSKRSGPSLFD